LAHALLKSHALLKGGPEILNPYLDPANPRYHEDQCWSLKPCEISVHAESNAIAFAAKHGISTTGAELFTTMTVCLNCAKLVVNGPVRKGAEYEGVSDKQRYASGPHRLDDLWLLTKVRNR